MEKLLLEACLDLIKNHQDILIGIQDTGAAGLVSLSAEMASKAGSGLTLELDKVSQRETQMSPYEMLLPKSQKWMLTCMEKGAEQQVCELFQACDSEAVAIGSVADNGQYRVFHGGKIVADVPVDALAEEAPVYQKVYQEPEQMRAFKKLAPFIPEIMNSIELLKRLL